MRIINKKENANAIKTNYGNQTNVKGQRSKVAFEWYT